MTADGFIFMVFFIAIEIFWFFRTIVRTELPIINRLSGDSLNFYYDLNFGIGGLIMNFV